MEAPITISIATITEYFFILYKFYYLLIKNYAILLFYSTIAVIPSGNPVATAADISTLKASRQFERKGTGDARSLV